MPRYTVAAPSYLKRHGRPTHPMHLAEHKCFGYAYLSTPGVWHYTNAAGEQASVRPAGQLRVNNGEALLPSVIAGLGIADLPDFIVGDAIASGEVEVILKGWHQPEGAVHLVTPPGGPRPARVEVLADFLAKHFAKSEEAERRLLHPLRAGRLHERSDAPRGGVTLTRHETWRDRRSALRAMQRVDPHPQDGGHAALCASPTIEARLPSTTKTNTGRNHQ